MNPLRDIPRAAGFLVLIGCTLAAIRLCGAVFSWYWVLAFLGAGVFMILALAALVVWFFYGMSR